MMTKQELYNKEIPKTEMHRNDELARKDLLMKKVERHIQENIDVFRRLANT